MKSAKTENRRLSEHLFNDAVSLAQKTGASAVLANADAFDKPSETASLIPEESAVPIVLMTRHAEPISEAVGGRREVIPVPGFRLTRTGQTKIAVMMGVSLGVFKHGDRLIAVTGVPGSGLLDSITIIEVGQELEMFAGEDEEVADYVNPEVFEKTLDIAVALGSEGREGRPIGTIFVIGDTDRLEDRYHQMVLNPFRGYPEEERNVLDPRLEESLKEFAAIDGAFIIRGDGLIETAGAYLQAGSSVNELPHGLGARHHSAAGITADSRAVAITVSASSGNVTVFRGGKILFSVERRPASGHRRAT